MTGSDVRGGGPESLSIRSLGHRTALTFSRFEGKVIDRGSYLVIRTPRNQTYRWGNYLLFAQPPVAGDDVLWPELFLREMRDLPDACAHRTFAWDAPDGSAGDLSPFLERGYSVDRTVVLTARSVVAPERPSLSAEIRPLQSDDDWAQATRNQLLCSNSQEDVDAQRLFKERQMRSYRDMAQAGLGDWFGAFEDGRLVADLGLFVSEGIGRFQQVGTAPEHRRRGLCGSLVHGAALSGFERMGAETLVLVAEEGGAPARIYGRLGFQLTERLVDLEKLL